MYSYAAYGLQIRSALPLPELVEVEAGAEEDVVVRLEPVDRRPLEFEAEGGGFWATADEACRFVPGVGAFLVRGGREVIVDPLPGIEEHVLRLPILGPVLALVLHQRGRFVLHASAVEWEGGAVIFTGGSGWGKSTLAAAFHASGYNVVADDVAAIATTPAGLAVLPGFPQLKLWPDAIVALGESPESMPHLHPLLDKRARRLTRGFANRHLPLRRVYVLAEGPVPAIEPLRPRDAMIEFVRHWYGARFGDRLLLGDGAAAWHFQQCAQLATRVPVHRLSRPRSMPTLIELASLVEADLATSLDGELPSVPVTR
jgi:hypothetical protein